MTIKTISSREVYRNPWTSVREDVIERANGKRGIYGVIDKDPACIVIPLESGTDGEFVYLIEQFRYTVGARLWSFRRVGGRLQMWCRRIWLGGSCGRRPG